MPPEPTTRVLPDLLRWQREVLGDEVWYRFANGLTVKTEVFHKADAQRILPLGRPQGSLLNHMVNFPDVVRGKRVLEPFAGSGAFGLMALKLGARHVDFLDINPRAIDFQRENAALNQIEPSRFRSIQGDIRSFSVARSYDLILANPPFVPTPEGIDGTITSNGGPEGNRLVAVLLRRMEEFLQPQGTAFICVFQFVRGGRPLVVDLLAALLDHRKVELTPAQQGCIGFAAYRRAYARLFPGSEAAIGRWEAELVERHGRELGLCHYVVHVGPRSARATSCSARENFPEKFGEDFLIPAEDEDALAFGRVFENLLPVSRETDPGNDAADDAEARAERDRR